MEQMVMDGCHIRDTITGRFMRKHSSDQDKLYKVWCAMKERCSNPRHKSFHRYGGRGIRVCDEWASDFGAFASWAFSNDFDDGLTIDRIDGNGDYTPNNCRWVTTAEQNRNYSRNRFITYNGRTMCVQDWANELGINRTTILYRLNNGKTVEQALSKIDGRTARWKK